MTEYEKVQLKVYIDPDTRKKLDELTEHWVMSNSALVEELIIEEWELCIGSTSEGQ